MFVKELVAVFILLMSVESDGLGTEDNHFQFVEMGINGVQTYSYHIDTGFDDYTSVYINSPIRFGEESFRDIKIRHNGIITFPTSSSTYLSTSAFTEYSSPDYIIAPFWDYEYYVTAGQVRYEVHTESSYSILSQQLRDRVGNYINEVLAVDMTVRSLLVVEWSGLKHNAYDEGTNRFQALVATDNLSGHSYAIFTYKCGELQWSFSSSTIGFKATNGLYRNHPFSRNYSRPNPIACVNQPDSEWSNVVYRIDSGAKECSYYSFGCGSGTCVSSYERCNGYSECYDGVDEAGCSPHCFSWQFQCTSGYQCVPGSHKCNGNNDCVDGSDEVGCSNTGLSTGSISGIVSSAVVVTTIVCVVIVIITIRHQRQRAARRVQFQRLRSQISVRPQATPTTQTLYFHPKPGEWYQTIEGHWVQGPPPAYSPADEGVPLATEGAETNVELIGGFGEANNASGAEQPAINTNSASQTEQTSLTRTVEVDISSPAHLDVDREIDSQQSDTAANVEVGVASDQVGVVTNHEEENPFEASSSETISLEDEDTPLIES